MSGQAGGARLPAWVPALWAGVLVATAVAAPQPAHASHPNPSTTRHINTMHFATTGSTAGAGDEQFCVESHDTAQVSHATARSFVNQTLTQMGADKVWDGLGEWRIDLWVTNNYCSSYSQATRATIEIEVHYGWNWNDICGGNYGYYNCVVHDNAVWNDTYGHYDSKWAYVYLVFSSGGRLDNVGRAFINHEFGHVFGLADDNGNCNPASLMHSTIVSYSCGNWPNYYPSPADRQSVVRVMG
jgi:hypothetical protein